MDGILNILKPPGMTSFDVVGFLRRILKTKKIGHTGTLDPGAVGVLPICIGNATKAIEFMMEKDKLYRAELTLGAETDTQDSSGKVVATYDVNVDETQIRSVMSSFLGTYEQIPPMYSAVKIEGKKLYELAREGKTIEREPRTVEVFSIDILKIKNKETILFDVHCSKGTYIRTLCDDIGKRLGCGGHMSFLIRTKAGPYDISSAITLEEVEMLAEQNKLEERFLPVDTVFQILKPVVLNDADSKRFLNGVFINCADPILEAGENIRVYNNKNCFLALGEVILKQNKLVLKSKKVFNTVSL
ncbi:MAG: tRNA pseudouridine(55) synthase TruB [Clostridia bacterium]|nr:tRNA pseudouridine(55) synthase TruB [Clostridia bacterium]